MRFRFRLAGLAAVCSGLAINSGVLAQDAPQPPATAEVMDAAAPTGPDWWIFPRSVDRSYLIDVGSIMRTGEELTVDVARVKRSGDAGDYSRSQDRFGVRCDANQARVDLTMDIFEDGEPTEAYATDEDWAAIEPGSLEDGVRQVACPDARPPGPSFPSIKAYIDAGRP